MLVMWVSHFEIDGSTALLGKAAKDANVKFVGYPISSFHDKDKIYAYFVGFLFGEPEDKKKFLKFVEDHGRIIKVENKDNFLIFQIIEDPKTGVIYNHKIVHVKLVEIRRDGSESWTIASWDKEDLIEASNFMMEHFAGKLLKIQDVPIHNFSLLSINPKLSPQQQRAMMVAIENGYYEYPRKITLEELAKIMKISFSTYQMHLRKAEQKMIPFIHEKMV